MNRMFRRTFSTLAPAALLCVAFGQAPHPLTATEKARVEAILAKMTQAQKLDYIGGTGFAVRGVPELGLPALEMSDGPIGVRSNTGLPSTTYAGGIGLAASWDRDLAARVGAGIGRDARARGVHFMLGPGVNIYRSPRNGRNFEYFGEDPFLASGIAVGYITGMQTQGVSATVKHFLANSSEYLRHDSDSRVDERTLHEIYLPAFEASVKQAHVGAVMDSYNLVNGLHATENPAYNTEVLRKEWGFTGVLMSDWDATYDAVGAANGGLDLEMPTGKFMNRAKLEPALASGAVKQAEIDEKVRRILSTAESFGWLDRKQVEPSISYADSTNAKVALDAARESIVLLKNAGGLLPLDKTRTKTILVVGPGAYPGAPVGGGSAGVVPFHNVGLFEGLTEYLGAGTNVLYARGLPSLQDLAGQTSFVTDGKSNLRLESFSNETLTGKPVQVTHPQHINSAGVNFESLLDDLQTFMENPESFQKKSSRRFSGVFSAPAAGQYVLLLEGSGEGSKNRVLLDDQLVIDNWELVRAFQPVLKLNLAAGPHKVVVEDAQNGVIGGHLRFAIVAEDKLVDPRAVELAKSADAVIVSAGFSPASESEGGDRTFMLPGGQDELIREMTAANPRTVVAVTSGGSFDTSAWLAQTPALLETWYGGQAGGRALAEVLFGEVDPAGHLPITFEARAEESPAFANYYPAGDTRQVDYKEGIFTGYRGYEHAGTKPLFPFGFGLSYTQFRFRKLQVTPTSASFEVTNTGSRAGAAVAELYVSAPSGLVPRPAHELKGFARAELRAGETRRMTVPLDPRSFARWDAATHGWVVDAGSYTVSVGDSVANLPLTGPVAVPAARVR